VKLLAPKPGAMPPAASEVAALHCTAVKARCAANQRKYYHAKKARLQKERLKKGPKSAITAAIGRTVYVEDMRDGLKDCHIGIGLEPGCTENGQVVFTLGQYLCKQDGTNPAPVALMTVENRHPAMGSIAQAVERALSDGRTPIARCEASKPGQAHSGPLDRTASDYGARALQEYVDLYTGTRQNRKALYGSKQKLAAAEASKGVWMWYFKK
jgi:hypothetical protein